MTLVLFMLGTLGIVVLTQNAARLVLGQPASLAIDAGPNAGKVARVILKVLLLGTLVGCLAFFPLAVGVEPAAYFGPMLRPEGAGRFWQGSLVALGLAAPILLLWIHWGWLEYGLACPREKLPRRIAQRIVGCVAVVALEEPFFRGILLPQLIAPLGVAAGVVASAAIFSAAHFLRRHKERWTFWGLFVLGIQLAVATLVTGDLWLAMGLHSGGVLGIQLHRLFITRYRGPAWAMGTRDFPICGAFGIALMVLSTLAIALFNR